jgi:hypothetical protein
MNGMTTADVTSPIGAHHDAVGHAAALYAPPAAFSSGLQITVLGARGVGKSTVARLIAALLARRGMSVGLAGAASPVAGRPGDGPEHGDERAPLCPPPIVVQDTASWHDTFELEPCAVDQVVVVTTPDVGAMQFAAQAARLVQHAGAHRVHLVINRAGGDADMKRALENLARADPANGSQYTSIHTLPDEPGRLPSDVTGWSDSLRHSRTSRGNALGNAVGWLVDDLVSALPAGVG